jgi:transcriptional regulator with XRE-family HTH domain
VTDLHEETATAEGETETVGGRLRALRRARRLPLSEVAAATGISASFLSLVENGRSDITIGRLTRLVAYYGVSITDLVPSTAGPDPDVVAAGAGRKVHSPEEGIDIFLLATGTNRAMMPMLLVFQPSARLHEVGRHRGEEFVHVLEGELRLEVEGAEPRTLRAGDSAYYESSRGHLFSNVADDAPLRLICIDSPSP